MLGPAYRKEVYQEYKSRFDARPPVEHLRAQLEYILHQDRVEPDQFLREIMDADGWYPLEKLMEYRSIKKLRPTRVALLTAARGLECVEVDRERDRMRVVGDRVELRNQLRVYLDPDDRDAMIGELRFHPYAEQKIGVGVAEIFIAKYTAADLSFFVQREDGSEEDFSHTFKTSPNRYVTDKVNKAFRAAVIPDIQRFKQSRINEEGMLQCEACPSPHLVALDECDADHHPLSFASIRDHFLEEWPLADVRISEVEGILQLADPTLREAFRSRHAETATLRIICKPEHRRQNQEAQRHASQMAAQNEGEVSSTVSP